MPVFTHMMNPVNQSELDKFWQWSFQKFFKDWMMEFLSVHTDNIHVVDCSNELRCTLAQTPLLVLSSARKHPNELRNIQMNIAFANPTSLPLQYKLLNSQEEGQSLLYISPLEVGLKFISTQLPTTPRTTINTPSGYTNNSIWRQSGDPFFTFPNKQKTILLLGYT